jgi:hypothetical protein
VSFLEYGSLFSFNKPTHEVVLLKRLSETRFVPSRITNRSIAIPQVGEKMKVGSMIPSNIPPSKIFNDMNSPGRHLGLLKAVVMN